MSTKPAVYIPPGGYLSQGGLSQSAQLVAAPRGTVRRRKKRATRGAKRATKRASSTRRTRRAKSPARLVKGSAAARRYMAKIRRMRRK